METLQNLTKNLNTLQRKDPYTLNILNAVANEIESLSANIEDFKLQYFFDTATWYLDKYERELAIKNNATLEEKRSNIEARWKSGGKSDLYLLQAIADSWKNGEVKISFINGKINIKFTGNYGVPDDLESLKKELDNAKPAHLRIAYNFKYLLVEDIHQAMTLEDMEQIEIDKFAF